jgi:hypothetical protein
MIVRSSTVEWDRLVELASSRGQALRLRDALTYLSRLPRTEIPPDTTRALAAARVSPRERLLHRLASGSVHGAGSLPELAARHLAASAGTSALATARTFPARLRVEWETPRTRELPAAVARRVSRRLRGPRR